MATVTEMREWLRANTDEDIPARGRLRPELVDQYNAAHTDGEPDDWDADGDGDIAGFDEEPEVPLEPERRPRTARTARAEKRAAAPPVTAKASSLLGSLLGGDSKKNAAKKGKAPKRTSLEKFIANRYSDFGKLLANISIPTSRCVQSQAAFAGVVWEDILRDTIVDKALQPAARIEEKLDKGFALVVTPLAVLAIEQTEIARQQETISVQQYGIRTMFLMSTLRAGLRKQIEIGRLYADQITAKLAADVELDAEVDALIAMIFAPPQGTVEEPEMAGAAA